MITSEHGDTVFLVENVAELPEVVVAAKQKKLLHILAYVREYSSLTSYTDTISLFREKMVDFMLPTDAKGSYKGWRYPRALNSRSYYQFTNSEGLDSVSNRCDHHFSWSDWIGMIPTAQIPDRLSQVKVGVDTIFGKYSPTEIWRRKDDRFSLDINILAETTSRRWVPNISYFFGNEDTEFEKFTLNLNYDNIMSHELRPLDLTSYNYIIESRGRGRQMFRFNRNDQPFYVNTSAEVYILDKEFISVKDAKKWEAHKFDADLIEIYEPAEAPKLDASTLALIDRVSNLDTVKARLGMSPDRLVSRNVRKGHFGIGHRAFSLLKQLTGITYFKSHRNINNQWSEFRESRKKGH